MDEKDKSVKNMDIFDFQRRFGSNDVCWNYLFKKRWAKGVICPKCVKKGLYKITKRNIYECKCRRQVSLTSGTIMHRSRTPLAKWFLAIYLVQKEKNISIHHLKDVLKVAYQTAWNMKKKISNNTYKIGDMLDCAFLSFANNGKVTQIDLDDKKTVVFLSDRHN